MIDFLWNHIWNIIIIVFYILFLFFIFKFKSSKMKLNFNLSWKDYRLSLIGLGIILFAYFIATLTGFLELRVYDESFLKGLIVVLYFLLFISPIEEILFRGIIMNWLNGRFKFWIALIISSIIFGLAHLPNGATGVGIYNWSWEISFLSIFGGLVFGYIFYKSKSIVNSILVHATASLIYFFIYGGLRGLF